MSEVKEIIASRIRAIEAELADIRPRIAPLEAELKDLKRAEAALSGRRMPGGQRYRRGCSPKPGSVPFQALQVLQAAPAGLTASQVQAEIENRFGRRLDRTTVSPQLSRLRHSDLAEYENHIYRLGDLGRTALSSFGPGGGHE